MGLISNICKMGTLKSPSTLTECEDINTKDNAVPVTWNDEAKTCEPMGYDIMKGLHKCNPGEFYSVDEKTCKTTAELNPASTCTDEQMFDSATNTCVDKIASSPEETCDKYWDADKEECIDFTEETCTGGGGTWDSDECTIIDEFTNKIQKMSKKDFVLLIVVVFLIMYMNNKKFKRNVNKMFSF